MNPKNMEKMLKRLGMQVKELPVEEVILKFWTYQVKIKNPEVAVMNVMGKNVYQVAGEEKKEPLAPSEEDIKLVMEKTGKDRETVLEKLKQLNNDLAKAIIELKKESEK